MKVKVLNIVGARPNFMKIAPIHRAMKASNKLEPILVHTGQHYDGAMSKVFFDDLQLPQPEIYLGVGSDTQARQTAQIMIELEKVLPKIKPDLMVVVGDVNSTLAASLIASKLWIPVAHVEAGLRSFDRSMPEEINRILTDSVSEFLFVTEKSGQQNLLTEGVEPQKIYFVGNVMIDSLIHHWNKAQSSTILEDLGLKKKEYALLTLHRPSNVDAPETFVKILSALEEIQKKIKILFPAHPRSQRMLQQLGLEERVRRMSNFMMTEPLGYLDFLKLMEHARFVLTDSGGIQEETTYLGIPCLTLRENTERPVTVELGTNILVGMDKTKIVEEFLKILANGGKTGRVPELWDGKAAERIVKILEENL